MLSILPEILRRHLNSLRLLETYCSSEKKSTYIECKHWHWLFITKIRKILSTKISIIYNFQPKIELKNSLASIRPGNRDCGGITFVTNSPAVFPKEKFLFSATHDARKSYRLEKISWRHMLYKAWNQYYNLERRLDQLWYLKPTSFECIRCNQHQLHIHQSSDCNH